jgi:glycosyltransferase involved in cell wall biosynthesis
MPRLVVGMPAFNAEATIGKAVTSTLRAMPSDSELWVYDDKSADLTLAVLSRVSDKRLRVIAGDLNRGNGYARKFLMDESDSEFIAAMDSDDVTFPWRFRSQLRALREVDVVFGTALRFGIAEPGGSYRPGVRHLRPNAPIPIRPEEFPSALLFHCPVYQSSFAARRSAFDAAGGYLPMRYGPDYELFLRLAHSGARMARLGRPLIAYRYSAGQVTRRKDYPSAVGNSWRESRWAENLPHSYVKLFEQRSRPLELDLVSRDPVAVRSVLDAGLKAQLRHFRPFNRSRYARLLRAGVVQERLINNFFPGENGEPGQL